MYHNFRMLNLHAVKLAIPEGANIILGQSHFIKTVEDVYEAMVNTVPGVKFGVAFNEASGPCLTRAMGRTRSYARRRSELRRRWARGISSRW